MSIIDSNKVIKLREVLDEIFRESGVQPREIMKMVEYGSDGYNRLSTPYNRDGFEMSYALYFLPEHIPKVLIILNELRSRFNERLLRVVEIVDVGCGVGTSGIAYKMMFADHKAICLIDRDAGFLNLAKDIFRRFGIDGVRISRCDYINADIVSERPSLYFFANTLSENIDRLDRISSIIESILKRQNNLVVIIEPLNKNGGEAVLRLRNRFAKNILMPCISAGDCALMRSDNRVCHYNIRQEISRSLEVVVSSTHRMAKFYYLVLSNDLVESQDNLYRILEYPVKRPYGFDIRVCNQKAITDLKIKTSNSLEKRTINQLSPNDVILFDSSGETPSSRPIDFSRINIQKIS